MLGEHRGGVAGECSCGRRWLVRRPTPRSVTYPELTVASVCLHQTRCFRAPAPHCDLARRSTLAARTLLRFKTCWVTANEPARVPLPDLIAERPRGRTNWRR